MLSHDLKLFIHAPKPSGVSKLHQLCKEEWATTPPQDSGKPTIATSLTNIVAIIQMNISTSSKHRQSPTADMKNI